jgi:tRNA pseudouridine55 synthase
MMARAVGPRTLWRPVDGILLLDKPVGLSSNQALQRVRRAFRAKKAGHTGSLDPLASGVLPLCFGEATKVAGYLLDSDKTYQASLTLGARTTTGDAEGEVAEQKPVPVLSAQLIGEAMRRFIGHQTQIPPMYSALKRDGEPLYQMARRGEVIERAPREIRIEAFELLDWQADQIRFGVTCSKGTYVRTLGEDLAAALGTVGYLSALRRTAVGDGFSASEVHTLADIEALADHPERLDPWLVPIDAALKHWPALTLSQTEAEGIQQGRVLAQRGVAGARLRLYGPNQTFLGLGQVDGSGEAVRALRLLAT